MDVISNPADPNSWTTEVISARGEILVEILSDDRVNEVGRPVLRRKDEMKKNSRKRLRHILYHLI
jgi:hypothetical protein